MTAPAASLEADASQTETVELGVFDGVVDFGGTSGATVVIPPVTVSAADVIDDPAELPQYEGDGTVVINVSTAAASTATGCGNIIQVFTTVAAAEVSIAYRYETPSNPTEPLSPIATHPTTSASRKVGRELGRVGKGDRTGMGRSDHAGRTWSCRPWGSRD